MLLWKETVEKIAKKTNKKNILVRFSFLTLSEIYRDKQYIKILTTLRNVHNK